MMDIKVQLAPLHTKGLLIENPVIAASGTFGYGTEVADLVNIEDLGALVCKATTLEPREGNPQPRIYETDSGVLNSIGLQNIGVDALIKTKAPVWATWKLPVVVNIAGSTVDEYARVAAKLEGVRGISGIEINISCPNVKKGGIEFGGNPRSAAHVTRAVRSESSLPLIVKLGLNVTDIRAIAIAVCEAGADSLTLINTLKGMAIDIGTKRPVLGNIFGGLSGPALKPLALYAVYQVAEVVEVPIIGCGGIWNADDAIEFFLAGASAVQVGTACMNTPSSFKHILAGIRKFLRDNKYSSLKDIIGIARV